MYRSQNGSRAAYERAFKATVAAFVAGGMTPQQAMQQAANGVLTQSYLKLIQPLNTTTNVFQFPVLKNEAINGIGQRADEKRLNQQDSFFITDLAFYVSLGSSATATNLIPKTYPSPFVFVTTGAAVAMYQIYAGSLQFVINQSVIGPGFDMTNFLQVPQTQQNATAASGVNNDEFDPSQVYLMEPNINLVGTKNNQLQIVLPQSMAAADANLFGVWYIRGIQAQNVTLMS